MRVDSSANQAAAAAFATAAPSIFEPQFTAEWLERNPHNNLDVVGVVIVADHAVELVEAVEQAGFLLVELVLDLSDQFLDHIVDDSEALQIRGGQLEGCGSVGLAVLILPEDL